MQIAKLKLYYYMNWVLTYKSLCNILLVLRCSMSSKKVKSILMMESNEPKSLMEECQEYGIEYNEPYFQPVMMLKTEFGNDGPFSDYEVAIPYFYLNSDIAKSENLRKAIDKFNKVFWYYQENIDTINPIKGLACMTKYDVALARLRRIEKKENIKCYSRSEMHSYLDKYRKQKEQELQKAKAKVENAEMELK